MKKSAVFGAGVWLVVVALALGGRIALWVIEPLFLLAPLVLVPLGLGLIDEPARLRAARLLQPWCALAAVASFLAPRGAGAAALAAAWLAFTCLLALCGLRRFLARGFSDAAEVAIDAALLFVPAGGGWLVLSRLGARPLGVEEPVILLTAVHFHYAAFAALVLVGMAGRVLGRSGPYPAIVAGAIAGPPLVAAGITASPLVELLGAFVLAAALLLLAFLMLAMVPRRVTHRLARVLLAVSASSLLVAMPMALAYAWGRFGGQPSVALATMARIHGSLNALGFALCGLIGWTLAPPRHPSRSLL